MKIITVLDQHKLGIYSDDDRGCDYTRLATRAVLVDDSGRVALIRFANLGCYKLPGGGMDEGEDKMTALAREVREETGYGIVSGSVRELGHVVEYRNYCGLHQISYCYAVKVGELGSTNPTTLEKSQGIEVFWAASIDDAVKNIRENQATTDEDGDEIGLVMMNLRDIAILQAARATTDLSRAS